MEREAFLSRLRARDPMAAPTSLPHPLVPVAGVPLVRYEQDLDDVLGAFETNARLQGSTVERITSVEDFVTHVARAVGARQLLVSRDPEVADVPSSLTFDRPQPDADLGVVGAAYAIAATGTVVFDAARAGGRSASLLPPQIAVVVRMENVLRDAGELFRRMRERFPSGPPSQLVLCSGPSRSGDIEQTLTLGVHGPGRVFIGILE